MYGRIPNEEKMFEPGDTFLYQGSQVTVDRLIPHTVYYEHRPIASYQAYYYVITLPDGSSKSLCLEDIQMEE